MAQRQFFDSPFVPEHMIVPMENPPVRKEAVVVHPRNYRQFEDFPKIEAAAGAYGFSVRRTPEGVLFVSHTSSVYDLRDLEVPQAILITEPGRALMAEVPDVLSKIEKHIYPETPVAGGGYSGKVVLVELPNGQRVAVKRYNRYKTGEKLPIGGLEQADVMFKISKLDPKFRCPTIYTASQDMIIMEDISQKQRLFQYEHEHPDVRETTVNQTMAFQNTLLNLFFRHDLIGQPDPIGKHLYIDRIENGEFFYVLIDPNR